MLFHVRNITTISFENLGFLPHWASQGLMISQGKTLGFPRVPTFSGASHELTQPLLDQLPSGSCLSTGIGANFLATGCPSCRQPAADKGRDTGNLISRSWICDSAPVKHTSVQN